MEYINTLNKDVNLITPELRVALLEGKYESKDNKLIEKHKYGEGLYLIFIKTLNKEDKSLVNNYLYYDTAYVVCLLSYFNNRYIYIKFDILQNEAIL